MKGRTRVNHPPEVPLPADNRPLVAPIYQSVKFEFDTIEETERYLRGERAGFYYSRASNPTTRQLELLLAELEGRTARVELDDWRGRLDRHLALPRDDHGRGGLAAPVEIGDASATAPRTDSRRPSR